MFRRMFKPGNDFSLVGERIIIIKIQVLIKFRFGARLQQFHYVILKHSVALCMPLLGFSFTFSVQHCPYIEFPLQGSFVSYYLFNTTCFGLTGHHQVYTVVYENCCFAVMLL
jgi:hypothetical protein